MRTLYDTPLLEMIMDAMWWSEDRRIARASSYKPVRLRTILFSSRPRYKIAATPTCGSAFCWGTIVLDGVVPRKWCAVDCMNLNTISHLPNIQYVTIALRDNLQVMIGSKEA